MNKLIDLTGRRFGKLTVIGHSHVRKTKLNVSVHYWLCQCDCGTKKNVVGYSLTVGKTKACGCANRLVGKNNATWRGYEDISASFFKHIKWSAEKRNLEFKLTIEYLWELFLKQNKKCVLTGLDLTFPKYALDTSYNISLDRIDSSKGYIKGNVQWVDKRINFMKTTLDNQEFIELCKLVANQNK
jgi:hypothetical protein